MKTINSFSFLAIGKTAESTEGGDSFKRYVGLASSYVLAVNPSKKELDELRGFESANEPEYLKDTEEGKEALVTFIVRTDPDTNNGVAITNKLVFTIVNVPAYNKDKTKVQVLDDFGNHVWANVEDVKAGKKLLNADGTTPAAIAEQYHMARKGECDLVDFLIKYLRVESPFAYNEETRTLTWKTNKEDSYFKLEKVADLFKGDFSEIKEAIALRPNNKIGLLYGVRTKEGKYYQTISTKGDLITFSNPGAKALAKLEKKLASVKNSGMYTTTEFRVGPLQEWTVEPTNLEDVESPSEDDPFGGEMPW